MKNKAIRMFLAVGAACLCGSAVQAQSNDTKFDVPFAFQVLGKDFAAGKYVVHQGSSGLPSLQNAATMQMTYVVPTQNSLTNASAPTLVFHCYAGDTCFLSEINTTNHTGSKVPMSKVEKEIAKSEARREMATISIGQRNAD
jgi:hypothetical protein